MPAALELIESSMRLIGAIATGETPTADEANDALDALNDMLEAWSLQRLAVYRSVQLSRALIPGQATYTVGPGGQFSGDRPVRITSARVTLVPGQDEPIDVVTTDAWAAIAAKGQVDEVPRVVAFDPAFPLASVIFWPVPQQARTVTLVTDMQFSRIASVSDEISFPPGYRRALRYALAVELAPEFGVQASETVVSIAVAAVADVKRVNGPALDAQYDPALLAMGCR